MTLAEALDLALQRHRAGRLAEAEALYRQILAVQPNHADALHLLGLIAHQTGRHELAVQWICKALAIEPNYPAAHGNIGEAYRALGKSDEAIASYRRALELKPDYEQACYNLGIALRERGQLDEAIAAYRRALHLKPDYLEAHLNLGIALSDRGQFEEAIAEYRRALALQPDLPETYNNLAIALKDRGQLDEAVAACRQAIRLNPGFPEAHSTLGSLLKDLGQLDDAVAAYRRAVQLQPMDPGIHSNLIYTLHFQPGDAAGSLSGERRSWNRQFGEPLKPFILPHANDPAVARPLRIGYVSPDLRDQVVGRNLLPLFQRHDRRNFEILCYSGVLRPDQMTEEFRRHSQLWRSTVGLGDEALAQIIRQDKVDILVDLTQHMAGNRLPMFARQPAPVQVSFAGYPESAGLETIEYRISDRYLESDSANDETASREQVCLIDSFWCYHPCGLPLPVNSLPALES